jgi:hypothetical protein
VAARANNLEFEKTIATHKEYSDTHAWFGS